MENGCIEGTKDQSVTSTSEEALGRDFHVRHSECYRKNPTAVHELGWKIVESHKNS